MNIICVLLACTNCDCLVLRRWGRRWRWDHTEGRLAKAVGYSGVTSLVRIPLSLVNLVYVLSSLSIYFVVFYSKLEYTYVVRISRIGFGVPEPYILHHWALLPYWEPPVLIPYVVVFQMQVANHRSELGDGSRAEDLILFCCYPGYF